MWLMHDKLWELPPVQSLPPPECCVTVPPSAHSRDIHWWWNSSSGEQLLKRSHCCLVESPRFELWDFPSVELGTGMLWAVYDCKDCSWRNLGPVERDFWRCCPWFLWEETMMWNGEEDQGRMSDQHDDRGWWHLWQCQSFEGLTWRTAGHAWARPHLWDCVLWWRACAFSLP